jgi:hypothetical protein
MELIPGQNIRLKPAIPLGSNHPIRVMVHQLTAFVAVLNGTKLRPVWGSSCPLIFSLRPK